MGDQFPGLPGKTTYKKRRPGGAPKLCIATPDIPGFTGNGGIGSTYSNLALALSPAGHEVVIVHLVSICEAETGEDAVRDSYKKHGI